MKPKRYAYALCSSRSIPSSKIKTVPDAIECYAPCAQNFPYVTRYRLCIPNTWLLIPMVRLISTPLWWPIPASSSLLLSTSHPGSLRHRSSTPPSLHRRWRHRLHAARLARPSAASDHAAQDRKQ